MSLLKKMIEIVIIGLIGKKMIGLICLKFLMMIVNPFIEKIEKIINYWTYINF